MEINIEYVCVIVQLKYLIIVFICKLEKKILTSDVRKTHQRVIIADKSIRKKFYSLTFQCVVRISVIRNSIPDDYSLLKNCTTNIKVRTKKN